MANAPSVIELFRQTGHEFVQQCRLDADNEIVCLFIVFENDINLRLNFIDNIY